MVQCEPNVRICVESTNGEAQVFIRLLGVHASCDVKPAFRVDLRLFNLFNRASKRLCSALEEKLEKEGQSYRRWITHRVRGRFSFLTLRGKGAYQVLALGASRGHQLSSVGQLRQAALAHRARL
jgi:hypothetical protein